MHILATHVRSEFLATPQLIRFDHSKGRDGAEPTLLVKASTLLLKYIVQGVRMQLAFSRLGDRLLCALRVIDDERKPAILWSILERDAEKAALNALAQGESCQVFLFNELAVNVAWTALPMTAHTNLAKIVETIRSIAKTKIVAPFDGIIGARRVSVGTFIWAGQAITDLANIDQIRVTFSAPERFLSKLSRGAAVNVSTPAFAGQELMGKIIVIEPVIDPASRSARVVARVQNVGRKYRPGMSANVSAVLNQRPNALTIPNEAVFGSGNQSFVFVVKTDSTVARVPLTLGTRMSDVVEVLEGLEPGMTVVRAGHQKLFEGDKVMPMPTPSNAESTNSRVGG